MSLSVSLPPTIQKWLIGPIAHDSIDLCLKKAFPEACFFDAHSPLATQHDLSQFEGILCIEPFQRLMPGDLWELPLDRVALAKKPSSGFSLSIGEDLWAPTLRYFKAWIPLDSFFNPAEAVFLKTHHVETTEQVWTFANPHVQSQTAAPLFKNGWITPYAWEPISESEQHLLTQACPDLQYFINSHASRIHFYFSKIQCIVCPVAFHHPYLLQILAAGAQLWIPAAYQSSVPEALKHAIHTYEDAQSLGEQLNAYSPAAPCTRELSTVLAEFSLRHILPERLKALPSLKSKAVGDLLPEVTEATRLLHASGPHVLDMLIQLLKQPEIHGYSWRPLVECLVYLRFLLGDFIQDPQEKERMYRHVLGLSQRIPQKLVQILCQYFVYKLRLNYLAASEAIAQLMDLTQGSGTEQDENQQSLHYVLHLLQESLFLEINLTSEISLTQSVQTWLNFQRAYLLAYTERQAEAARILETTRAWATPPTLGSLWCALGNYRASIAESQGWRQAYPLHIWVGLKYIEALHRAQTPLESISEELQRLKALCLSLNGTSQELEKVLAYERQYAPAEPLENTVIQWEGPLYSYSSLAQINAYWLHALAQDEDYTPVHIPFEPPEQKTPVIDPQLPSLTAQSPAFFISHRWPPRPQPPEAGAWISMIPWEFGAIPRLWVERINQAAMHEVWVPSAYVAHSFWRSGVRSEKITVIPNGVDTQRFCPEGPTYALATEKSFCFLFVGGALERKGLDILMQAYTAAFSASDDVCLVIKAFGGDSHYALKSILPENATPQAPEIEYITQDLSPEEMAALYRRCQVYVHPYRGEGFALPILEAMASGTPAIIPDAGPAPEFCSASAGWYVPTRITSDEALNIAHQGIADVHAYFTTVDDTVLAEQMRSIYHTQAWKEKGPQAAQEALAYDWNRLYPRLKKRLQLLPPSRPQSFPSPDLAPDLAPLPSRLFLHNPWGLLPLHNTPEVQFVNDRVLSEQTLFYCLNADDIKSLLGSSQFSGSIAVCGTEALRNALIKGGWPARETCIQELIIDLQKFGPEVPAFHLEESVERFSFLLCFDWQTPGHWQEILTAYSTAFQSTDPVHLIFKPYNVDFETCMDAFMAWFESTGIEEAYLPDVTFMQEELTHEELPAFLRGIDCLIDNHSEPLALAAIASEVAVITASTLPCLQRPAAERYRFSQSSTIDQASLVYLLKDLVARPNPPQRRHARQDLHTRQAQIHWQHQLLNTLRKTMNRQA